MQYFAAMHDCSCLFLNSWWPHLANFLRKSDFGLTTVWLLSQAIFWNLKNSTSSYKKIHKAKNTRDWLHRKYLNRCSDKKDKLRSRFISTDFSEVELLSDFI